MICQCGSKILTVFYPVPEALREETVTVGGSKLLREVATCAQNRGRNPGLGSSEGGRAASF